MIEIRAKGYLPKFISIEEPEKDKTYYFDIVLFNDKTIALDKVIVTAKKRFEVKKDTLSYNVAAYSDGTEQKIEDIIEKLPGIQVNGDTGRITYKGRSIETVTLGGDNLFGHNYTIGTKNINVDMVKQVQAIENYSENPLLKGIEQSGKVALNLELKKGIDFSGNAELGSGLFEGLNGAYDIGFTILGIGKNFKTFGVFSYNNVGINSTPFDYFGIRFTAEQLEEKEYYAQKVIPEAQFSNKLDDDRVKINNQFFGNYNSIFNLGKRLSLKTNLYFLKDEITAKRFFTSFYSIDKEEFTTSDRKTISKEPEQYRIDLELKYNLSENSLLEYAVKAKQQNIKTSTKIKQNNEKNFNTSLESDEFYLKQNLTYTNRLSKKRAFQLKLLHSTNQLPQKFVISPSILNSEKKRKQKSKFKKTIYEAKATMLGAGKRDKYKITLGAYLNENSYRSNLYEINDSNNGFTKISENKIDYTRKSLYQKTIYNFNLGKWRLSPSYSLGILSQKIQNYLQKETGGANDFIVEPTLEVVHKLNSISFLRGQISYEQKPLLPKYLFPNQVLIDNRTTLKNIPHLGLQKTKNASLYYFNNDLYHQFQMNIGIGILQSEGDFLSNNSIDETSSNILYFFSPVKNTGFFGSYKISKYISFLKSRLQLSGTYSLNEYKNVVNNSDIRKNESHFFKNELFYKSAFEFFLNFENTFSWSRSLFKREKGKSFTNNTLHNNFKFIFKPVENFYLIFNSDVYFPDLNQPKTDFWFLDATFRYEPQNKNWETSLVLKNMLNEENFEQVNTSDISTSIYRSNLLERHFLISVSYRF